MEAVLAIVVGAASLVWWRRTRRPAPQLEDYLADDVQVVLHVAEHEQRARAQPTLTTAYVLYGLLQDATIIAAIRATGGALEVLEDHVLAALAAPADHQCAVSADTREVLSLAVDSASYYERKTTVTDLWAYVVRTDAATALFEAAELDALAALHHLVHRAQPPALADGPGDVHVVIRNDDYTPQVFVTQLLVESFELSEAEATTRMLAAHGEGKVILARLPAAVANARIREARARARAQQFPLWIAAEPA